MKKNSFIQGTVIASIAIIFIKFLGAIYVIPFYNIIGEEGGTLYSYAYNIYNLFLNISISGIPIAISKIITEYNSLQMYNTKEKAYKIARNIMAILAFLTFFVMFVFSREIASLILDNSTEGISILDMSYAIKMISFCLLIIPFLSVIKGYFQGHKFISPTSTSQVIEQVVRIFVVLVGSYLAIKVFKQEVRVGVGIALLGAFIGGLVAYLYLKYKLYKNIDQFKIEKGTDYVEETKVIVKKIFTYSIPLIIVSAATSLYDTTDLILVTRGLKSISYSQSDALVISSIIATWAPKICMIINAIAMGLSVNIIPHITSSFVKKDYKEVAKKIEESINTVIFITIPMAIGIAFLADPIYTIFYGESIYGGNILKLVAFIAVLASLNIVLNMILQSINKYKIAYINTIVGLVTNAILDIPLIKLFAKIGIYPYYGALCATIIGYILSFIIVRFMLKNTVKINYKNIFNTILKMILPTFTIIIIITILNSFISFNHNRIILCLLVGIYALINASIYFIISYKNGLLNDVFGKNYINKLLIKFKLKKES